MNSITRRMTLITLILGGIACIIAALIVAPVAPVLGPVGTVLLAGAFGMFQSVIEPTDDVPASPEPASGNTSPPAELNVNQPAVLEHPNINILFQYNQFINEPLADPNDIVRPSRPLLVV